MIDRVMFSEGSVPLFVPHFVGLVCDVHDLYFCTSADAFPMHIRHPSVEIPSVALGS